MPYPITDIRRIGADVALILKWRAGHDPQFAGVTGTQKQRLKLAEKIGTDDKDVLDWVTAADRMRVKGVGWDYAELLCAAGVKTVNELKFRNPREPVDQMTEANAERRQVTFLPSVKMVERWIDDAKKLPPIIRY